MEAVALSERKSEESPRLAAAGGPSSGSGGLLISFPNLNPSAMMPRNAHLWLPGLLSQSLSRSGRTRKPRHVLFAVADHYEPYNGDVSDSTADARVSAWLDR